MAKLLNFLGPVIYWLAWPFWFVYFKFSNKRSRVFVLHGDQVLLVRNWLGERKWSLPGGGSHRGEDLAESASRELKEEVGIEVDSDDLKFLGCLDYSQHGLTYQAFVYTIKLGNRPEIRIKGLEIAGAKWFDLSDLPSARISRGTRTILSEYQNKLSP